MTLSLVTIASIMNVCLFLFPFDVDKAAGKHKQCYRDLREACDHKQDPHKCVSDWVEERMK
jgi:hypothetical protein